MDWAAIASRIGRHPGFVALGMGALSACGFAPFGAWPLTLAAFVVLIALVGQAPTARRAFAIGWLFGLGQFTVGLNWIAHAFTFQYFMPPQTGYVAVVLLSLYLAVYPGVATLLAWFVARRGGSLVLAFAAAWIATEYARATFFTGFAWNPLAVATLNTPLAGAAMLIGTYGVSGIVVLLAGAIASVRHDRRGAALLAAAPVALMLFAVIPVSALGVREIGPRLRVVQPNIGQSERHNRDFDEESVRRLERLTGPPSASPRLILWPEAAVPYYLEEESWARDRLARLLAPRDLLLTGGSVLIYDRRGDLIAARNSLFAMNAKAELIARYDKAHLVPYGEYLPARPILSAIGLSALVQSDVDFVSGGGPATLRLPGFGSVGVQICYEIIFSGQVVDRRARPDFIFNPSTDAWFGAWGPPQHLAQAQLRAIEEGLPVVRATPTGISAVIDANGRLLSALPLNKAGFLDTRLPPPHSATPFARGGNAIPLALALLFAVLAVALRSRRR